MEPENSPYCSLIRRILLVYPILTIIVPGSSQRIELGGLQAYNKRHFFIKCTLTLTTPFDDSFKRTAFYISHSKRGMCNVHTWRNLWACTLPSNPATGQCGCSDYRESGKQFTFYYYLGRVNHTLDEEAVVLCMSGNLSDSGTLRVHRVVDGPGDGEMIYGCTGKTLRLPFSFTSRGQNETELSPLTQVILFKDNEYITTFHETLKYIPCYNNGSVFTDRLGLQIVSVEKMILTIKDLTSADNGIYQITIVYKNSTDDLNKKEHSCTTNPGPEIPDMPPWTNDEKFLTQERRVFTARPPEFSTDVGTLLNLQYVIVTHTDVDGIWVMFTCRLYEKLERDGIPPTNITLLHGNTILKSAPINFTLASTIYEPDRHQPAVCQLVSSSFQCLSDYDRRKAPRIVMVTDEIKMVTNKPFPAFLFIVAILINLILLWWTYQVATKHVDLIRRRKTMLNLHRARLVLQEWKRQREEKGLNNLGAFALNLTRMVGAGANQDELKNLMKKAQPRNNDKIVPKIYV